MTFFGLKPPTMIWSIFESSNFSHTVGWYWNCCGFDAWSRSAKSSQDFHAMTLYCHAFDEALSTVRVVQVRESAAAVSSSAVAPLRAFLAAGSICPPPALRPSQRAPIYKDLAVGAMVGAMHATTPPTPARSYRLCGLSVRVYTCYSVDLYHSCSVLDLVVEY